MKAMEQPQWNEGRLDDLSKKVDEGIGWLDDERKDLRTQMREGFEKVDGEFKEVRGEMRRGFNRVDQRFEKVDQRFGKVEDELKGMQRLMVQGVIGLATLSGSGFAAMVVLIVALAS